MSDLPQFPRFSVVIPTCQRRELVCDSVRALARLRYGGPIELIVVVDGSNDGTAEALAHIECPFPYHIIEQSNAGAAHARNTGAASAGGDIILFLDDDMIAEPDLVEQHARKYRSGADAVLGNVPLDSASPAGFLADGVAGWAQTLTTKNSLTALDVFTGQLSVRRSVFEEVGGFDESFTSGSVLGNEDADFGVKLLPHYQVRHNPKAISRQRYIVTPAENMRRVVRYATADIHFASKHPRLSLELFRFRGAFRLRTRLIYHPLARVPLLPKLLSETAIWIAEASSGTRLRSNRIIARFFGGARSILYWSAIRRNGGVPDSDKLLVLCYHAIADLSSDPVLAPYGIRPEAFAAQLDSLMARGFTFVSPDQAEALIDGGGVLPEKSVLLTFDDCYEELEQVARTILKPRGIRAIAFAVSGMRSQTNEWDQARGARRLGLLDSAGLKSLERDGVEIGCHSRSHRPLPSLTNTELVEETGGAADDLASLGLPRPRFFAYPHGEENSDSRSAVRSAGFTAAFGLTARWAIAGKDRFDVPRIGIVADDRGWRFRMKTSRSRLWTALRVGSRPLRLGFRAVVAAAEARTEKDRGKTGTGAGSRV